MKCFLNCILVWRSLSLSTGFLASKSMISMLYGVVLTIARVESGEIANVLRYPDLMNFRFTESLKKNGLPEKNPLFRMRLITYSSFEGTERWSGISCFSSSSLIMLIFNLLICLLIDKITHLNIGILRKKINTVAFSANVENNKVFLTIH